MFHFLCRSSAHPLINVMTKKNNPHLRLLRAFLGASAITWGVSVFGVFLSWPAAVDVLQGLGANPIPYDRMLDYWLRMAAGAFGLLGGLFLVLMMQPLRHLAVIPWFGSLMLVEGAILLAYGIRLNLPPLPFYGDVAACFGEGIGILWCCRRLDRARRKESSGDDLPRGLF